MSNLSFIDKIYKDYKSAFPDRLEVKRNNQVGIIRAVGHESIFVSWYPFINGSLSSTPSERINPNDITIIGLSNSTKKGKFLSF
jgi:hypothetical protein